jgi:putative oxidoreductase
MILDFLNKYRYAGFMILRLGIGAMFIYHGYGMLAGGPALWAKVGAATTYIGIKFAPVFFGFLAALAEFGGGICLITGVFFREACFFMFFTMLVASNMHLRTGDGFNVASHAIEAGILFLSLIFIGPGGKDHK